MAKTSKKSNKKQPIPTWVWAAAAVVILAVIAVLVLNPGTQASDTLPREVSVAQAAQLRDDGAFILDVREQIEWDEVHVPGATLIPLGSLASRVNEVPKDQDVVVICRSGNRSQQGRDILLQAGFTNVTSVAGGITQWRSAGYPTVSGP